MVGTRGALAIPAAARQLCAIATGEPVVLVADLGCGVLTIHPARTVARMLAELHTRRAGGGHG
ncbi:hypothetical protein [Dactylosporangium sp. NPDC048998]|uniref:hypothetical protein n=1 Tax=Dactylosporangium sp. NPDC048998 TaxID=3363976 RepID=UPI003721D10D